MSGKGQLCEHVRHHKFAVCCGLSLFACLFIICKSKLSANWRWHMYTRTHNAMVADVLATQGAHHHHHNHHHHQQQHQQPQQQQQEWNQWPVFIIEVWAPERFLTFNMYASAIFFLFPFFSFCIQIATSLHYIDVFLCDLMTSWQGCNFRIAGPMWGESTRAWRIPLRKDL